MILIKFEFFGSLYFNWSRREIYTTYKYESKNDCDEFVNFLRHMIKYAWYKVFSAGGVLVMEFGDDNESQISSASGL